MSIELKKHNEEAYKKIQEGFKKSDRVAVIHPTGTGKSFLALKFIEDNKDKKAIYIAPSNAILHNIKKSILDSDMDMTDLPKLKRVLYQGLMNLSDEEIEKLDYDIIILDEFHHCGAPEWGNGVDRLLMNNPDAQVLGLSATPIRYFDKSRNMAEELFEDNIASEMSLEEAINEGILPNAKYVSALYGYSEDLEKMKFNIERIKDTTKRQVAQEMFERLSKKLDENTKNLPTLLSEHMTNKNGKYIVFCKNIEDMNEKIEQVQAIFGEVSPNIKTYAVSSKMKENDKMLTEFENDNSDDKLKLMFAVDMLNEGYHINDLDGVVMMRPTYSPTIYEQQLGRALSVKEDDGKQPVIIDLVNNFDSIKIIEDLYERLNAYKLNKKEHTTNDNGKETGISIFDTTKEFRDIAKKITELTTAERKNSISLQEKIEMFESFLETGEEINGQTIYEGYPIGQWAIQIRSALRNGKDGAINPNKEQLEKLSNLGILDRQIDSTIDEKIDAIIEWYNLYSDIEIERKGKDREISEKTLNKLREIAESTGNDYLELVEKYKKIQSYNEYVRYRNYQGKLNDVQLEKCKEINLGKAFGYSSEIEMLSNKYQIEESIVYDICKKYGSFDNFIKINREEIQKEGNTSHSYGLINTLIDTEYSENSENYSKLVTAILGITDSNIYLYSSKGIDEALNTLMSREKEIIVKRYGLEDGIPRNLEEMSQEYNYTRERIRQIEAKALRRLRHPRRIKQLDLVNLNYLKEDKYISQDERKELERIEEQMWNSNLIIKGNKKSHNIPSDENKLETNIDGKPFYRIYDIMEECKNRKNLEEQEILEKETGLPLENMELSVRAYNCLKRSGIHTSNDFKRLTYEELCNIPKLGMKCVNEVMAKLIESGITLKDENKEETILDKYINGKINASVVKISDLDLPTRAMALYRTPIKTLEDLINTSEEELMQIKKLGNVTVKEIINRLKQIELLKEQANKENGDTEKTEEENNSIAKESEEKIMDNVIENNENVVEEIDPEEYLQEWKESGEESYYKYLFNKYNTEKANGNEELAAHIYKVYTEAHELEQQWMGTADEEKMMDIEREKKKQREDLEHEDSINSYPEEPEEVKSGVETEEKIDLGDKTIEELEAIIAENEGTIAGNDKEIKERLIQKILGQQQTIAKQQEEIDRLKSQKVIK